MIFYVVFGTAVALVYAYWTAGDYAITGYGAGRHAADVLHAAALGVLALLRVADTMGGDRFTPRPFVGVLVFIPFVVCVALGAVWCMLGMWPAAAAALVVAAATMVPGALADVRGVRR